MATLPTLMGRTVMRTLNPPAAINLSSSMSFFVPREVGPGQIPEIQHDMTDSNHLHPLIVPFSTDNRKAALASAVSPPHSASLALISMPTPITLRRSSSWFVSVEALEMSYRTILLLLVAVVQSWFTSLYAIYASAIFRSYCPCRFWNFKISYQLFHTQLCADWPALLWLELFLRAYHDSSSGLARRPCLLDSTCLFTFPLSPAQFGPSSLGWNYFFASIITQTRVWPTSPACLT